MHFGRAIGTACSSFAVTNIDDIFVLVTFMAEAATSKVITPWKVVAGQYLGFTVIVVISMIGFGVSLVLPSEPIGFLGLLPILLGIWNMLDWVISGGDDDGGGNGGHDAGHVSRTASLRGVLKVALVTLMNGGDNIGTYIPLFSQTKGAEIAVYVVVYYILVGLWCLAAFLVMRQRHVLRVAERYANLVVPLLYVGLGIFILVKSECYPWSIEHLDESTGGHWGRMTLAVATTGLLLICIGLMAWWKWRKRGASLSAADQEPAQEAPPSEISLGHVRRPSSEPEGHDSLHSGVGVEEKCRRERGPG